MIDLESLLRIPCVEVEMGFDLSPDGDQVVFSWNPEGNWEIYQVGLSAEESPKKITQGDGGKFHPRFSPHGKKLAYVVDFDGSEAYHLIVQDLEFGTLHDLTGNEYINLQADFCWSPDGKQLAFISDKDDVFDTFIIPADGGKARKILSTGFPSWKVRWSPDGQWLAVVVEAGGIDYNTYLVKMNGMEEPWIIQEGNNIIDAGQVSWAPDSNHLAFTSDVHGMNNIGIMTIDDRSISWLTGGEGEKQFPTWSPDGKQLAYIFNRGAQSWLAIHKIGKSPLLHQVDGGVHYLPKFTPGGDKLVFIFDSPRNPPGLWTYEISPNCFTQLTEGIPEEIKGHLVHLPEEVMYPSLDGTPVPALLFRSSNDNPGPGVIIIHGGPDWFFEMTWYPLMVHMASRGWTVLAPNYRGSTGYGREWQEASRFDFGGVDNDDVAAGADFLVSHHLAQPGKIGITGRSHGGYLVMTCLTRYPDKWTTGSSVVPFINWFTNHKLIRQDLQHWDLENFGDPVTDHDLWVERSPYFSLEKIKAPIQLIAGRQDQRCPVSDSIEAYQALTAMKKPVELIIYEDEGHSFLKIENIIDSERRRVEFLSRYLDDPKANDAGKNMQPHSKEL